MGAGRIEKIELFHLSIPLPAALFPVWIPGYPQYEQRHTILRLQTREGLVGWASGPAFDRERDSLGDYMGQFLLGLDPYDLDEVQDRLHQASFLGWHNKWIDIAFWDLAAQARGVPVYKLMLERLGRQAPERAPSLKAYASFLELRPPGVRAEALERAQRLGFTAAKVCVSAMDAAEDRALLRQVRAAVGPRFALMAHAHQGFRVSLMEKAPKWSLSQARDFLRAAHAQGFDWVQEPLHDEAFEARETLAKESKLPLAGGDLATSLGALRAMLLEGSYGVLTPDPAFAGLGNIQRLLRMMDAAPAPLSFSPSCKGDGLGLLASAHALAAWCCIQDKDPLARLEFPWEPPAVIPEYRDILLTAPLRLEEGRFSLPQAPGLGAQIDPRTLEKHGERFYSLTPVRFAVSTARRAGLRKTAEFTQRKRRDSGLGSTAASPRKTPVGLPAHPLDESR